MERDIAEQRQMIENQGRQIDQLRLAAKHGPVSAPGASSLTPVSSERLTSGTVDPVTLFIQAQSPAQLLNSRSNPAGPASLPDDLVFDLIRLYFVRVQPWAPILLNDTGLYARPWSAPVLAILVITVRFSDDPRLRGIEEQVRTAARESVIIKAVESTSLETVQGLALLALDLIGSGHGPDGWGIMGLLSRSAVHMGLCSEDDTSLPATFTSTAPAPSLRRTRILGPAQSWKEDESRRRLFWLIFCLDRFTCVTTGWEFALPNYDINRRMPSWDTEWEGPVSLL
jgi:hypothetical protein